MALGIRQTACLGAELLIYEINPERRTECLDFLNRKVGPWLKEVGVKQVRAALIGTHLVVLVAPASPPWETEANTGGRLEGFRDLLKPPMPPAGDIVLDLDFGHQSCAEAN